MKVAILLWDIFSFIKKKHFIHLNFTAKAKNPNAVVLNEEAIAHKWVTLKETKKMDLEPTPKN